MPKKAEIKQIKVKMPAELKEWLRTEAKRRGISMNKLCEEILGRSLR